MFNSLQNAAMVSDEPSHDKNFDTHAVDYNSRRGKTHPQPVFQ